jgi:hypothetical protein
VIGRALSRAHAKVKAAAPRALRAGTVWTLGALLYAASARAAAGMELASGVLGAGHTMPPLVALAIVGALLFLRLAVVVVGPGLVLAAIARDAFDLVTTSRAAQTVTGANARARGERSSADDAAQRQAAHGAPTS